MPEDLARLKSLLATVPEPVVQAPPWLSLAQAWIYAFTSQLDAVVPLLERVEDALSNPNQESESHLLPTHLSSTETAEQLYVSKNTVRSHIGHIYDKLGVHSRENAVQRALELGLL